MAEGGDASRSRLARWAGLLELSLRRIWNGIRSRGLSRVLVAVAVVATAVVLIVLAVVMGVALTANLLALSVTSQRQTLAALQAIGLSRTTLLAIVGIQGVVLGALGWAVAATVTPVAAAGLDHVAAAIVGYEELLLVPHWLYPAGAAMGLSVGTGGAVIAGLLVLRLETLHQLSS